MESKFVVSLFEGDDETTVSITQECITWREAHSAFFRFLRGAGYVINGEDYVAIITEDVMDVVEAERPTPDEGVATELSVGGGGFLTGEEDV